MGHDELFRSTALNQPHTGSVRCLLPAALVLHCQDHLDRVAAPDRRGERDTPVVEALPLTGRQGPRRSSCAHNQQCHRVQGRNQARCERCPHRLMPAVAGREGRRGDNQGENCSRRRDQKERCKGGHTTSIALPACPGRRSAWGARNPVSRRSSPVPSVVGSGGRRDATRLVASSRLGVGAPCRRVRRPATACWAVYSSPDSAWAARSWMPPGRPARTQVLYRMPAMSRAAPRLISGRPRARTPTPLEPAGPDQAGRQWPRWCQTQPPPDPGTTR